jgi:DNA-binding transcriptional regulator YiaG
MSGLAIGLAVLAALVVLGILGLAISAMRDEEHLNRHLGEGAREMTGDDLAHALEALKLTQTGLARALGVEPRTVRYWIAKAPPAPVAKLVRLVQAGRITIDELAAA